MSGALKCRVPVNDQDCGKAAAVGLVTVSIDLTNRDILELNPLCEEHAPEVIHELSISTDVTEWSVVTLAYGASGGDLR